MAPRRPHRFYVLRYTTTVVIGLLGTTSASAQELNGVNAQRHQPATGATDALVIPALPRDSGGGLDLITATSGASLVRTDAETGESSPLVGTMATSWLGGWWGGGRWQAGAWLPVHVAQVAPDAGALESRLAVGDVRLHGTLRLDRPRSGNTGLALTAGLGAPTGDASQNLGSAGTTVDGGLMGSVGIGPVSLLGHVGIVSGVQPATDETPALGPQLQHRWGARVAFNDQVSSSLVFDGAVDFPDDNNAVEVDAGSSELLAGVHISDRSQAWTVRTAAGLGTQSGPGTPPWRFVLGVSRSLGTPDTPAPAPAPAPTAALPGQLILKVRDPAGNALDARVRIEGSFGVREWSALNGELSRSVPAGAYALSIRAKGFAPMERAVELGPGGELVLDTVLTSGRVRVEQDQVVLTDRIFFETDSATIERASFPLLQELTAVLIQHPELTRIAIHGHTDDVGDEAHNLSLSLNRASAVRTFLVASGIAEDRLTAYGFGESQPLIVETSTAARAANRRVEFRIVSRTESGSSVDTELE